MRCPNEELWEAAVAARARGEHFEFAATLDGKTKRLRVVDGTRTVRFPDGQVEIDIKVEEVH